MGCCMTAPGATGGQAITVNQDAQRPTQNRPAAAPERAARQAPARSQRASGSQRQGHSQNNTGLRITYLQNPTVEIIKHDKTVGQGVQKTLAYDTPMSSQELEKWRAQFWETRTNGSKEVWQLLQNACSIDHEDALACIQAAQLQLPQDSLTTAIDQAGVYYRVPIACIQNPDNYSVDKVMDAIKAKKAPSQKTLTIKVRNFALGGDKTVQISNNSTIEQFKQAYFEVVGSATVEEKGVDMSKLRFFCMGKELKNELFIYSYDLSENVVVQAMIRQ